MSISVLRGGDAARRENPDRGGGGRSHPGHPGQRYRYHGPSTWPSHFLPAPRLGGDEGGTPQL